MPKKLPKALQRSEHDEQVALFAWSQLQASPAALLFAIPNGGQRHKAVAAKLKTEGVCSGVPDLFLPVARGSHHGLFIEMKRADGVPSDVSVSQHSWHHLLIQQGYSVVVCFGFEQARTAILEYLNQGTSNVRYPDLITTLLRRRQQGPCILPPHSA